MVDEVYPSQSRKVTEQLNRLAGTSDVQAVLNLDFGAGPSIVTQLYRRMGFRQPLYQSHAQASDDFLNVSGEAANGVRIPAPPLIVLRQLPDNDPLKRMLRAYDEAYRKRWDVAPNVYGSHAHDAFLIAIAALVRADTTDKAAVRAAIESTRNFPGTNGIYRMSADDHMGLDLGAFRMAEARAGSWDLIE